MDKYNEMHLDELNEINFNIGEPNTNENLDQNIDLTETKDNFSNKKDIESGNQIKSDDFKEETRLDNGTMDEPIYITLVNIIN